MLGSELYALYAQAFNEHNTGVDAWDDLEEKDKSVWNLLASMVRKEPTPAVGLPACKGMNCGTTTGTDHSLECQAQHAAAVAGGRFVKLLSREAAVLLLKGTAAANEAKEDCEYLDAIHYDPDWMPHEWTIAAVLKANGAE